MDIIIAGDLAPRDRMAEQISNNEFGMIFPSNLCRIIQDADYSIVNLECPICEESYKPIRKCGPNLKCTEKAVSAIKYAGFKGVTLANNHILDYGEEGLMKTIECLSRTDIDIVGAGKCIDDARKILYFEKEKEKIAIINICEHEFSFATEERAGANSLEIVDNYHQIIEAKKDSTFVIVIVHGGHEHFELPSIRMQNVYRYFIEIGADIVVNHHQHCLSGFEIYNGKPIFYGLGNFAFDWVNRIRKDTWNKGFLLKLTINNCNLKYELIPYIQYGDNASIELIIDTKNKEEFNNKINLLNQIICDKEMLSKEIKQYYDECAPYELSIFEPYGNRLFLKLYSLGLLPSFLKGSKLLSVINHINCESHRDKVIYALDSQLKKK